MIAAATGMTTSAVSTSPFGQTEDGRRQTAEQQASWEFGSPPTRCSAAGPFPPTGDGAEARASERSCSGRHEPDDQGDGAGGEEDGVAPHHPALHRAERAADR